MEHINKVMPGWYGETTASGHTISIFSLDTSLWVEEMSGCLTC